MVVDAANHFEGVDRVRSIIRSGENVPLAFSVLNDYKAAKESGVFTPKNCEGEKCFSPGRHAVLAGNAALDENENFHGLYVKNSWGPSGSFGFYTIEDAYFREGLSHFPYWEYLDLK